MNLSDEEQEKEGMEMKEMNDINWSLDASGKLTVTGKGKIPDYSCGNKSAAPWNDVKDKILAIEISEGITEIGINAFRACENLKSVTLPDSLFRIHAYAFWNCIRLKEIDTNRTDFKYIYDCRKYKKEITVTFGIGSFHNVPWSNDRWGGFYCEDGCLYVCFSSGQSVVIPDGIRVLKPFSLSYLDVEAVFLPDTLKIIENFAFSDSAIREKLVLPDGICTIEANAFSVCSVPEISFPASWRPDKMQWGRTGSIMVRRRHIPEYINKYSIALLCSKKNGKFRSMKIMENKPIRHKDGTVTKVRDENYIDVGKSIYRRIRNGKIILCITYEYNRIISVKSFSWDDHYGLPEEYLMYPMRDNKGQLVPWRDSFTYQEEEDIVNAFYDRDGEALKDAGLLRFRHPDTHEEWFWSDEVSNYGGPLELELLDLWLKEHADITVDSMEENIEHDKTRWFVGV